MSKVKTVLLVVVVFFFGVMVGSSGGNSSSTGKSNQTSVKSETELIDKEEVKKEVEVLGKVEVKSHKQLVASFGSPKIVGEVVNNTPKPVSNVKVTATFYDVDGDVVGTEGDHAGDTWDTPLLLEATAPFEIVDLDNPVFESYKLDVVWD